MGNRGTRTKKVTRPVRAQRKYANKSIQMSPVKVEAAPEPPPPEPERSPLITKTEKTVFQTLDFLSFQNGLHSHQGDKKKLMPQVVLQRLTSDELLAARCLSLEESNGHPQLARSPPLAVPTLLAPPVIDPPVIPLKTNISTSKPNSVTSKNAQNQRTTKENLVLRSRKVLKPTNSNSSSKKPKKPVVKLAANQKPKKKIARLESDPEEDNRPLSDLANSRNGAPEINLVTDSIDGDNESLHIGTRQNAPGDQDSANSPFTRSFGKSLYDFLVTIFDRPDDAGNVDTEDGPDDGKKIDPIARVTEWLSSHTDMEFKTPSLSHTTLRNTSSRVSSTISSRGKSLRYTCITWNHQKLSAVSTDRAALTLFCGQCARCKVMFECLQEDLVDTSLDLRTPNTFATMLSRISKKGDFYGSIQQELTEKGRHILEVSIRLSRKTGFTPREQKMLAEVISVLTDCNDDERKRKNRCSEQEILPSPASNWRRSKREDSPTLGNNRRRSKQEESPPSARNTQRSEQDSPTPATKRRRSKREDSPKPASDRQRSKPEDSSKIVGNRQRSKLDISPKVASNRQRSKREDSPPPARNTQRSEQVTTTPASKRRRSKREASPKLASNRQRSRSTRRHSMQEKSPTPDNTRRRSKREDSPTPDSNHQRSKRENSPTLASTSQRSKREDSPTLASNSQRSKREGSPTLPNNRRRLEKDSPTTTNNRRRSKQEKSPTPDNNRRRSKRENSPTLTNNRRRPEKEDSSTRTNNRRRPEKEDSPTPANTRQRSKREDSPAVANNHRRAEKEDSPKQEDTPMPATRRRSKREDSPVPANKRRRPEDAAVLTTSVAPSKESPRFSPGDDEFSEGPIAFAKKTLAKYGDTILCGIATPTDFKPPCTVPETPLNFKTTNMYIHRMLTRWSAATEELAAIRSVQDSHAQRSPLFDGLEVDLVKLFYAVQKAGGLECCHNNSEKWKSVADTMKLNCRSKTYTKLENIYLKYLLNYNTLTKAERAKARSDVRECWASREQEVVGHAQDPLWRQTRMRSGAAAAEQADDAPDAESHTAAHVCAEAEDCVTPGRAMNINMFRKLAQQVQLNHFPGPSEPTPEQVETEYWRLVMNADAHVCVHAASVDATEHASGFPTDRNDAYTTHPWNLKRLRSSSANILSYLGPCLGVSSSSIQYGMCFATSCWHMDPTSVPWIEYLHDGPPKIWYSISAEQQSKFRTAAETLCPWAVQNKDIWLPSDILMIPPSMLRDMGVTVERHVQHKGEFVIVYPNTYCANITTGFTISEGVYFAPQSWIAGIDRIFTNLRECCEPSLFSAERLLIAMVKNERTPKSVLRTIHTGLVALLREELSFRQMMASKNIELLTPQVFLEQHPKINKTSWQIQQSGECAYCRRHIYLSRVVGVVKSGLCAMHGLQLFESATSRQEQLSNVCCIVLMSNAEIYNIINKLKQRVMAVTD